MRQVKFEGEKGHDAPLTGYLALRARDFVHPREVVSDKELHPFEKRAILAAWASDISAVDSRPQFRWLSGTPGPVALSQILAALQQLDGQTEAQSAVLSTMSQARSGPRANGGAG
jgi:hypothetical protein